MSAKKDKEIRQLRARLTAAIDREVIMAEAMRRAIDILDDPFVDPDPTRDHFLRISRAAAELEKGLGRIPRPVP